MNSDQILVEYLTVLQKQIMCPDGLSSETLEWCRDQLSKIIENNKKEANDNQNG